MDLRGLWWLSRRCFHRSASPSDSNRFPNSPRELNCMNGNRHRNPRLEFHKSRNQASGLECSVQDQQVLQCTSPASNCIRNIRSHHRLSRLLGAANIRQRLVATQWTQPMDHTRCNFPRRWHTSSHRALDRLVEDSRRLLDRLRREKIKFKTFTTTVSITSGIRSNSARFSRRASLEKHRKKSFTYSCAKLDF